MGSSADVTLFATAITALVTIILFGIEGFRRFRSERLAARRDVVSRVLDVVSSATQRLAKPQWARMWGSAELDFALVLPRLLLELDKKDRPVAEWAWREMQRMQLASTEKESLRIGITIGTTLIGWHHGEVELKWFAEQIRTEPPVANFRVPAATKLKRLATKTVALSVTGLCVGAAIGAGAAAAAIALNDSTE